MTEVPRIYFLKTFIKSLSVRSDQDQVRNNTWPMSTHLLDRGTLKSLCVTISLSFVMGREYVLLLDSLPGVQSAGLPTTQLQN